MSSNTLISTVTKVCDLSNLTSSKGWGMLPDCRYAPPCMTAPRSISGARLRKWLEEEEEEEEDKNRSNMLRAAELALPAA